MASPEEVRKYLAYWFQLGKHLKFDQGETLLPNPVIAGNRYSAEFEACWQRVLAVEGKSCYLDGTDQTIAELLSGRWDLASCARCGMPVPLVNVGIQSAPCPCFDLPTWPNLDLPLPRLPIESQQQLEQIRARLSQRQKQD